ncbi:MAG: hypothetical protein ABW000_08655 [Actinoplanes sp.]
MAGVRQVLFIQGVGAGTHDEWDNHLCDSLRLELSQVAQVIEATWTASLRGA